MLHLIAYCTAMTRPTVGTRAGGPLMCAANDDASLTPGVRLSGVIDAASLDDVEELNLWCGDYKLERRNIPGQPRNPRKLLRSVMGRPAYRHAELPSRWLVWNGARWIGQMTEDLPWGFGIKQEIGQSEFDRDQNPNMYPTVSLPADVASPGGEGANEEAEKEATTGWFISSRSPGQPWAEEPGLRCTVLSEADLEAAAEARLSKRRLRTDGAASDKPFVEVCFCSSCERQGSELTLRMLRQLGADSIPTPTRGACGGGPMAYIGLSDLKLGGLSYGAAKYKKAWRVFSAAQAAELLEAAGAAPLSSQLVEAYDALLSSYSTSSRRPSVEEALRHAEQALADTSAFGGFPLAHSAALARRGELLLEADGESAWPRAEKDAREAIRLDPAAEAPRRLLAEILWRTERKDEAERELEALRKLLLDRRDEIERKRAKLSGAMRSAEFEELVTGLPKRRREIIDGQRRRLAFAPPLPTAIRSVAAVQLGVEEEAEEQQEVRVQAD
jgi:tetratricopeptide (TPR) repeat protein